MLRTIMIIMFISLNVSCQQRNDCNQKIIYVEKDFNLQINVCMDSLIDDDILKYTHVIEQKLNFAKKNKIVKSISVAAIFPERILTSVDILKIKRRYYYRFEFFKSNGGSEIYQIYDLDGNLIENYDSIGTHLEAVENFDLTSLYLRQKH